MTLQIGGIIPVRECKRANRNPKMQMWNHTVVCKPDTLIGYQLVGVFFALRVEKGLR